MPYSRIILLLFVDFDKNYFLSKSYPTFNKSLTKAFTLWWSANILGRTPDEGSPSFFALQRNSPFPAFMEGYYGATRPKPSQVFLKKLD